MKTISIIVTYNGEKWIRKCLESILSTNAPVDILVIDNQSTDNTQKIIKDNYPKVDLICSDQNLGFGKANNIGLKRALNEKYDYVFLLNQDAWIEKNTINELIEQHLKNPQYGILAPLQLNGDGSLIDSYFQQYTIAPCRELITNLLINGELKDIYTVPFANAACWLLPKETLQKIGGFDPLFPHYGEDDDYVNRAKQHGIRIGLCPHSKVYHDREMRIKAFEFKKEVNYSYIRLLADLKNHEQPLHTKFHYVKKAFLAKLNQFFGSNSIPYKIQYNAIKKIIQNYPMIMEHRNSEKKAHSHYIAD